MRALSVFNRREFKTKPQILQSGTISDFSGGLNAVDNDLTMKTKYAVVLKNWQKGVDATHSVRWGTKFKYNIAGTVTGTLIELLYFNRHMLAITSTGQIAKITEAGVITKIWDATIAAALPGAPAGWSNGQLVGAIDYSEFKGDLIIVNGIDKPLLVKSTMLVQYLNDPATGSNVNTPIGKYVTTAANYLIISGIAAATGSVYISSQGTSGVFVGDPLPNDGLVYSLDTFVPENSKTIIGLGTFRNFLLAFFEGALVVMELGLYTDDANPLRHTPQVQDNIVDHGVISHRTTLTTKTDFIMADPLGCHSALKNQFGLIDTKNVSELVDPIWQATAAVADTDRIKCFTVHNRLEHRMFTFMPTSAGIVCWNMTFKEGVKDPSWSQFYGWSWTCGCASEKGRVFFGLDTKIYQYGNDVFADEDYTADFVDNNDGAWATLTAYLVGDRRTESGIVYNCITAHVSSVFADDFVAGKWEIYLGEEIAFDWELPWSDLNKRTNKKKLGYIQADTQGTASFTFEVYVDNFRRNSDNDNIPALTMNYVAGESNGFGNQDQPFGGGRRLRDERPWGMPVDFKLAKLRLFGSTKKRLKIVTISLLYSTGSHRRA